MFRKLRLLLIESDSSVASCSPVLTSTVSGIARSSRVTSSCGVTPGSAATWIESTFPRWSARSCATGSVTTATVAPPSDSTSPKVARPEILKSFLPVRPTSETRSPIFRPSSSAVPLLIATSWGLAGGSPSTYSSGSNRSGGREKSNGGAPPVFTWSPFALKMEAKSSTFPAAVCTPGTSLTRSTRESGISWVTGPLSVSNSERPLTTTSTPSFAVSKTFSNVLLIVSVKT